MTSENEIHVGKPPQLWIHYWKVRMTSYLKALSRKLWRIINYRYVILDEKNLTPLDKENDLLNDQGVNMLFSALDVNKC